MVHAAEPPPKLPIFEGEVLAGKYKVVRLIGVGGMGAVVECRHVELGQRVALKFLLPEVLSDHECVTRFSREAKASVRLKGEHVARVTDVGRLTDGAPYMVMEYLSGHDLAAVLKSNGPLSVEEATAYLLQACEGVAEAHAIGIVHRDIKPRNLFVTKRPNGQPLVKVLDFGIAKDIATSASSDDTQLTKVSSLIGSPHYISPEQMTTSGSVDTRTDIWSLGVCLYEMLTCEVPFDAPSVLQLCSQVLDHPARPITDFLPDLSPGVVAVIDRCLQKNAADRFQDVAELAMALEPFAPPAMQGVAIGIQGTLEHLGTDDTTGQHLAGRGLSLPPQSGVAPASKRQVSLPPPPSTASVARQATTRMIADARGGREPAAPAPATPASGGGVAFWILLTVAAALAGVAGYFLFAPPP